MKQFYLAVLVIIPLLSTAQSYSETELLLKPYDSLITLYDSYASDTLISKRIGHAYLKKARVDLDSTKIARGYQRLAFVSEIQDALKYLDSAISYSKSSTHRNFPASAYLFKAFYLYNSEAYEESLDNAFQGYQHARAKGNVNQQIVALNQMNGVNELWGDYKKSLETAFLTYDLLAENKEMEIYTEYNLSTLEGIGICYVHLKKPDSALIYFKRGIEESLKAKDTSAYYAFVSRTGTALYVSEKYEAALDSLKKGDIYRDAFINSYLTYYNYYMGGIYANKGDTIKSVKYFEAVDSIYNTRKIVYPELPRAYNHLVDYYREQDDKEKQLEYLYKLVAVDSLINAKRKSIKENTDKEYEIPKLLEEKEILIDGLEKINKKSLARTWWIIGFLLLSVIGLLYYFRRQQQYKRRFENLISGKEPQKVKSPKVNSSKSEISSEIVDEILRNLDKFESNKDFLSQEITLNEVAKSFGTNSTYLSKVINLEKGKNFSHYINDLRIDYTVEELKDNLMFRKYTIKAIANESGFKSAESFSKTFYKKYGIYPSYYIKQLGNN